MLFMKKLLEMCIRCGFVHRDDRTKTRQRKTHYHWQPVKGEQNLNELMLHATVCHSRIRDKLDWKEYISARKNTDSKYYIKESFNATLPESIDQSILDEEYSQFCAALLQDL